MLFKTKIDFFSLRMKRVFWTRIPICPYFLRVRFRIKVGSVFLVFSHTDLSLSLGRISVHLYIWNKKCANFTCSPLAIAVRINPTQCSNDHVTDISTSTFSLCETRHLHLMIACWSSNGQTESNQSRKSEWSHQLRLTRTEGISLPYLFIVLIYKEQGQTYQGHQHHDESSPKL